MSDDAAPVKRGRKSATEKADKAEPKKRARKETKAAESGGEEDGVAPVKRGRGRPKGSTKKKSSPAKPKSKGTGEK